MNQTATPANRIYIAIDLKSFYASVECVERGLDPLTANLVVADAARTEKTICLAVSPSLKAYGIPGRARLFEVIQKVKEINRDRSSDDQLDFIAAKPRMALYMEYSARIYQIYLKYAAPEDIHVYSIDEIFMDVTQYLHTAGLDAHDFTRKIISDILSETGITATAGIAPNMYLCKVAMDIVAKHIPADKDGVRIAELDEISYRKLLWNHRPLTDFWRVGRGISARLEERGIYTMGDIARCSLGGPNDYYNEDFLFRLFGVNAELLIDHAWGYEPCTIRDIKEYKPENNSVSCGQVLSCPYDYEKCRLIVREMADSLAMDLVAKGLETDQIVLTISYDRESLSSGTYKGEITSDYYGRRVPKHANGSCNIGRFTSSARLIMESAMAIYDSTVNPKLLMRRINICAEHVISELEAAEKEKQSRNNRQLDFFTDFKAEDKIDDSINASLDKEKKMQQAALMIRSRFGKNAILKGMNLEEGANARERNQQIGGHHE